MRIVAPTLVALAVHFATLSLLAFGGANAVVPEMQRQAVLVAHWMTASQFAGYFALAQSAPGPNFMIATLVGLKAAGIPGALIASIALCAPSCLLAYWVAKGWERYRHSPWRKAIGAGLAPVAVGLVTASGWTLARAADHNIRLAAVTAATAIAGLASRHHPLWFLGAAAALGAAGVLG